MKTLPLMLKHSAAIAIAALACTAASAQASAAGLAPDVREFAHKTPPTLKEHLSMAQQLMATESKGNHSAG